MSNSFQTPSPTSPHIHAHKCVNGKFHGYTWNTHRTSCLPAQLQYVLFWEGETSWTHMRKDLVRNYYRAQHCVGRAILKHDPTSPKFLESITVICYSDIPWQCTWPCILMSRMWSTAVDYCYTWRMAVIRWRWNETAHRARKRRKEKGNFSQRRKKVA